MKTSNKISDINRLPNNKEMAHEAERFIDSSDTKKSIKYISRQSFHRYDNTLKNLIPVRTKDSVESNNLGIDGAGLFSFIYSNWLTKYLVKADSKGILHQSDIPSISQYDCCSYNAQRLEILWNDEVSRKGSDVASFGKVIWRFVRTRVLASFFLIFISQAINFLCTMLLTRWIIEHLENPNESFFIGLQWVILLGISDIFRALVFSWAWMVNYRTALRLKAACLTLLFKKVIFLNNTGDKTTGQLINIFSNDGQKISDVIVYGPMIICGPVIIMFAIITILVWLSPLALLGIGVFLMFYPIQCLISSLFSYYRRKTVAIADRRIQSTIEALECIKIIKMYGCEEYFSNDILTIRDEEKKWLWKTACTNSFGSSLTPAVPIITIIVTFLSHLSMGYNLTAAVAFPVATYFLSLKRTLTALRDTVRVVVEARISLDRFKAFPISSLIMAQLRRSFGMVQASLFYLTDASVTYNRIKSVLLLEDTSCHISKPIVRCQALAIVNGRFVCDVYDKQNTDLAAIKNKVSMVEKISQNEIEKLNQSILEKRRLELLSDVTFEAVKGKLVGVCGHVASGKSSLLLAALGQLRMTAGQLMRDGSCAYVSQQPWVVNATLRENILFGETFDPKRYYKTLALCCLKEDINQLPNGDQTEIGEKGVNLSGGQKQRISLARAYYSQRDIYFLDDPLSAVDTNVSLEIFENLILEALGEKTVIMVTHHLQHLSQCDDIYLMRNGRIIEHGSHEELLRMEKEYAAMVKSSLNSDQIAEEVKGDAEFNRELAAKSLLSKLSESDDQKQEKNDRSYVGFIQAEKSQRGGVKPSTYVSYINASGGYCILALILLAFFMHGAAQVFTSWWLAVWLKAGSGNTTIQVNNETIVSDNIKDNPDFAFYETVYWSSFFFIIVACLLRGIVLRSSSVKASMRLHKRLLQKIISAPVKFFDTTPIGRIQNLFSRDMEEVDLQLPISLESTLQCIFLCIFTFLTVILTLPYFIVPLIVLSILFYHVWKVYRSGITNLKRLESTQRSPVYSFVTYSIQGLSTIRAFKKENEFLVKFQELLDRNNVCSFMCDVAIRWLATRFDTVASGCVCIAALLVIMLKGQISSPIAGLALTYSVQISGTFQYAIRMISEVELRFVSVERICNYIRMIANKNSEVDSLVETNISPDWPKSGRIRFVDVELKYNKDSQSALKSISFEIEAGEKIGIVGRTGSGKSSLVTALFRLYELSSGQIYIDDVDISKIDVSTLRKHLTIIPQDPILFSGTIRYYLDPEKNYNDEEIWDALERTQLKTRITMYEEKLDAIIKQQGQNLSMGERQLLCLTKALLRNSRILILDEATASIDPETEAIVHQTIQKQFFDSTVLIIAHRLPAVMSCNRILVMDEGCIAEFESPSLLLNNVYSKFARLFAAST